MTRMKCDLGASIDPAPVTELIIDRFHDLRISVVARADRGARVRLFGVLDLATTQQLETAVDKALAGGHTRIRLDLTRVWFCDGAGIGGIVRARRAALDCGAGLTLTGVSPRLRKILRLVGIDALEEQPASGTRIPST